MKSWVKITLFTIAGTLAVISAVFLHGITFSIDFLDAYLESIAARLAGRQITIDGPVWLNLSPHPGLEFGRVTIANPDTWDDHGNLLSVNKGRAKISLLPLLQGQIRIEDLEFFGADVRLVTHPDHSTNFEFQAFSGASDSGHEFAGLDKIVLRDIQLSYFDQLAEKEYVLTIDEARGQGQPDSTLQFLMQGKLFGQDYSLELAGGVLRDLIVGRGSWPLEDGELRIGDMVLNISGAVHQDPEAGIRIVDVVVTGKHPELLGELFDVPMPEVGDFSLRGRIGLLPGRIHFTGIALSAMSSAITGDMVLLLHEDKPTLAGDLSVSTIDPFIFPQSGLSTPEKIASSPTDTDEMKALPWEALSYLDTDLQLRVESFGRGIANGLQATLLLVNGDLLVPFKLDVIGTPASGRIDIQTDSGVPEIEVELDTGRLELGALLSRLNDSTGYGGQISSLGLRAKTGGRSLAEIKQHLDLAMHVGPARLDTESGVLLTTEDLSLDRAPGAPYFLAAQGDFLDRPLELQARLTLKEDRVADAEFLSLNLKACDTDLQLNANVQRESGDNSARFRFTAAGEKLCGLLAPLLAPLESLLAEGTNFSLRGDMQMAQDSLSWHVKSLSLGPLKMDATANIARDNEGNARLSATIHSKYVDLAPLFRKDHDTPRSAENANETDTNAEVVRQIASIRELLGRELISNRIILMDNAGLNVHLEKLDTGRGSISDLKLSAEIKDGKLTGAPFRMAVANQVFTGDARLDFTGETPTIEVEISSRNFDLGKTLSAFSVDLAPDITADRVDIRSILRGRNILEFINQGSHEIAIHDGRLRIHRILSQPLIVDIHDASLRKIPGKPVVMALEGFLASRPFDARIEADGLFERGTSSIGIGVRATMADTRLEFDGRIRKQKRGNVLRLSTLLAGNSLEDLNEVLGIRMPPLGPYRVAGSLRSGGGLFTIDKLELQVGDSVLRGELEISGERNDERKYKLPLNFRAGLDAKTLQLRDFHLGEWSPVANATEGRPTSTAQQDDGADEENVSGGLNDLISPEFLGLFEGSLTVNVTEVLSGKDKLGSGQFRARIKEGSYVVDTLRVDIPGGSIYVNGSLKPETDRTAARLAVHIDNLDYGILVRRVQPDSGLKGQFNLHLDASSEAEDLTRLKEHANGTMRFGIIPEKLLAGIVDIWAVNVVVAALPTLMDGKASEVNCLMGDFRLEDGMMRPDVFVFDTSEMRVEGTGEVNFKTNAIDFHLVPLAKNPQFFSLATPVSVSGTITDFDIGVTAPDVLETVFRLLTSVVAVPIKKLFSENLDTDGRDVCTAAMDWVHNASIGGPARPRTATPPSERRSQVPGGDAQSATPEADVQDRDRRDPWWGGDRQH